MSQRAIDGDYIYFVTTNVKDRRWYFVYPDRAKTLDQAIRTSCQMKLFELLAFCILPNHMHLLVQKSQGTLESMPWDNNHNDENVNPERMLSSVRSGNESKRGGIFLFPDRRLSSRRDPENEQRKLESMRWGNEKTAHNNKSPGDNVFLYQHRRLSSRRSQEQQPTLSQLMQSIKGSFSRTLPLGPFWQRRSYVLHVESEEYPTNVVDYIRFNYTKMDLPDSYGKPPFVFIDEGKIALLL